MSSTKLFNKNYLLENIKKSKGLLILFLSLVPIFTCISLVLMANNQELGILSNFEISIINIIGMYVIPVIISYSLFGYIYKKVSVDFINSMPINKKSIFVTNTIGGILLILLMQAITLILLFICNSFSKSLIIFPQIILDSFIMMTISYIFVFAVTNVAMSISGNILTQIAVTMLILFLVPFCIDSYEGFSYYGYLNYEFVQGGINDASITVGKDINYTMPYRMFSMIIRGYQNSFYSINSILRMIILSAIYFIVGKQLFEKRKMENTEESFSNVHVHLLIKGLTIIPMIVFLNQVTGDTVFNIFAVALIAVYYFIYDLVTKRKVNFLLSLIYLVATLIIIQSIYIGTEKFKEKNDNKYILKNEVSQVSIDLSDVFNYYSSGREILDYYIDNDELLELIFEEGRQFDYSNSLYSSSSQLSYPYYTQNTYSLSVNLKMNNGKILRTSITLFESTINEIIEILSKDEEYVNIIKNIHIEDSIIKIGNKKLDDEIDIKMKEEMIAEINNMNLKEYFDRVIKDSSEKIYLYYYKNHKIITESIPIELNEEIFKVTTSIFNETAKDLLELYSKNEIYYNFNIDEINNNRDMYEKYGNKLYTDDAKEQISEFIKNNYNVQCNMNEKYYIIRVYGSMNNLIFLTNSINEIMEILDNVKYDDMYIESAEYEYDYYDNYTVVTNTASEELVVESNIVANEITEEVTY